MSARQTRASSRKKAKEPSGSAPSSGDGGLVPAVGGGMEGSSSSGVSGSSSSGVAATQSQGSGSSAGAGERAGVSSLRALGSASGTEGAPAMQVGGNAMHELLDIDEMSGAMTLKGAEMAPVKSPKGLEEYAKHFTRVFGSCCSAVLGDGMNGLEISRWLKAAQHAARSAEFLVGPMPDSLYGFMHALVANRLGPVAAEVAINMGYDHGHGSVGSYLGEIAGQALRASAGFVRSRAAARRILFVTKQDEGESVRAYMKRYRSAADAAVVGMWGKWAINEQCSWHREMVNGLHEGLSSSVPYCVVC